MESGFLVRLASGLVIPWATNPDPNWRMRRAESLLAGRRCELDEAVFQRRCSWTHQVFGGLAAATSSIRVLS
jgi:hypothetical protein